MADKINHGAYGERIGGYIAGSWEGEPNGRQAAEEIDGIVDSVLTSYGRTVVTVSGVDESGGMAKDYYAEPPFEDADEATAVGLQIQHRWETWIGRSMQPISTDEAGVFETGQISRLQQTISEIKA